MNIFSDDIYGQMRKKDLVKVTKELYSLEPRIFYRLKSIQEKSLLGFLNLLLVSEERESILTIVENIVSLTQDQRIEFSNLLKKTKLENILGTMKMIESRYFIIEALKKLIYDCKCFTNERDHIQKIIEQNYWLFGEKYNLVTSDERMQKALEQYLYIIDGKSKSNIESITDETNNRRMDIFICQKRKVEDNYETDLEENLIVELKAPKVKLTNKIYRQIEDYMNFIYKEKQFNSQLRRWKFIAVCTQVDEDIKIKYDAFKDKGKKFLVYSTGNYEIYAMSWDDVFKSFEISHGFVYEKLKYDCEQIANAFNNSKDEGPRQLANEITKKVLA